MAINGRNVVDLVKECSKTLSFPPKVSFYLSILQGKASKPVVKITNLNDAYRSFNEMLHRKPLPSVKDFNQLLNLMYNSQYHAQVELFGRLKSSKVHFDIFTLNIVTKCCSKLLGTRGAFTVLGCDFKLDVVPDVYTFSTLLNGLINKGKIQKAENFFNIAIEKKLCIPNEVIYSTMIKGLCKVGSIDKAVEMLREMQKICVKSNVITYSIIISGFSSRNRVDEALKLFDEMKFEDIQPDCISCNAIIDGLCSLSRFEEVNEFLRAMKDDGIDPDVITYTPLVKALCTLGRVANAKAFVTRIIKKGVVVDSVIYTSLINGYVLRGEMINVVHVFETMKHNGVFPDVVTYNSIINGFFRNLAINNAFKYFDEISRVELKPTVETYNTMIHGLFKAGKIRAACNIFNTMEAHDSITFRIVLEGLFDNKQTSGAFELLHLISKAKTVSDLKLYNILIQGSIEIGELQLVNMLLGKLIVNGMSPDTITCNEILIGLSRNGLFREAEEWFFKMGDVRNSVSYNFMIILLLKDQNQADSVNQLLVEMDAKGLPVDAALISLSRVAGDLETRMLIRKMAQRGL